MNIKIINYEGKKAEIEVPEDAAEMLVSVVSGDELVSFWDKNNKELTSYDSAELTKDRRMADFYDGGYTIPREKFEKWNAFEGDSYDRLEAFEMEED